jgi:hemolysin III
MLMWKAAGHGALALGACAVYAATLVALFGVSSSYHRYVGRPEIKLRWQRADHSMIFLLIAGTYTPLCLLGVGGTTGTEMLAWIWGGALIGVVMSTVWTEKPRGILALLCIALGWILAVYMPHVRAGLGEPLLSMVLLGGVLYTVGALIYAMRFPDPKPAVFGYHEVFHVLVIAAAICHFAVIVQLAGTA